MALPLPGALPVATLSGHTGAVMSVKFNSTGQYCLTAGNDRSVRLWNPHKALMIKNFAAHAHEVLDAVASEDNANIVSVGGDKDVFYWDVATGRVIRKLRGHTQRINTCVFGGEGSSVMVTGSYDKTVRVWDCRSRNWSPIQTIDCFRDSVTSVLAAQFEILAASVDGTIRTFDIRKGRMLTDMVDTPVTSIALSNDTNCVLASCLDSRLLLLERGTGELLNTYEGHQNTKYMLTASFTSTDAHVVSGSEDGQIIFWDLVEAKEVHSLRGHGSATVTCVACHPKAGDTSMVSCDTAGKVKFWK